MLKNDSISNILIGVDREGDKQSSQRSRFNLLSEVEEPGSPIDGGYSKASPRQVSEGYDRRLILQTGSAAPAPCPFCSVALNATSWW